MSAKEPEVKVFNTVLDGTLRPPAPHLCQQCAVEHEPELPHNQQSLFWQYYFYKQSGGRWPTWDDAMVHCAPEIQEKWKVALAQVLEKRRTEKP